MFHKLKTARLYAEPITGNHFAELRLLHSNKEVMKYIGGLRSEERTHQSIKFHHSHWQMHGYGLWMFYTHKLNQFVGGAGVRIKNIEGVDEIVVGYILSQNFWGQGFATEMAEAVIAHFRTKIIHNVRSIIGFTDVKNEVSKRVMEKAGFVFEKIFTYENEPHSLYRLTL